MNVILDVVAVLLIVPAWFFYVRSLLRRARARRTAVAGAPRELTEPPSREDPAVVAVVIGKGEPSDRAVAATVLGLADRDVIDVQEYGDKIVIDVPATATGDSATDEIVLDALRARADVHRRGRRAADLGRREVVARLRARRARSCDSGRSGREPHPARRVDVGVHSHRDGLGTDLLLVHRRVRRPDPPRQRAAAPRRTRGPGSASARPVSPHAPNGSRSAAISTRTRASKRSGRPVSRSGDRTSSTACSSARATKRRGRCHPTSDTEDRIPPTC